MWYKFCEEVNNLKNLIAIYLHICFLCCLGCEKPSLINDNKYIEQNSDLLGLTRDRKFDFGKCLISPQLNLLHQYSVCNNSNQPINLLRALNQKPCCGDIKFDPIILQPGESHYLTVILKHNQSSHPLSHLAVIETDHPQLQFVEFYTYADPQPMFILERMDDSITNVKIGESKRVPLNFHCYGDSKNKPFDLDRIRIETDLGFEWLGPITQISSRDGFLETIRKGELVFIGQGSSGSRISAVQVKDNDNLLYNENFAWKVDQILKVNPQVLMISGKEATKEYVIVVNSLDGKAFKVLEIIPDLPDLKVSKLVQTDPSSYSFVVHFDQKPSSTRSGVIKLMTTHPHQASLAVSYFYISQEKEYAKKDMKNAQE